MHYVLLTLSRSVVGLLFIEIKKKAINLTIEMFCTAQASLKDEFPLHWKLFAGARARFC